MSLSGSRPPSDSTPDSKDSPDISKESKRKLNLDSGFDEATYSTPTPSTSGKNSHNHHTHQHRSRRRVIDKDQESAGSSRDRGRSPPLHKERHDSINSNYSDNLDYKNFDSQSDTSSTTSATSSGKSGTGTSSISSSIGDGSQSDEATCSSPNSNKTDVHFPPQPLAPPPTSDGTVAPRETNTKREYDFPSDTELSEIIAIMSGLATPRKQKQHDNSSISKSTEVSANENPVKPFFIETRSQDQIENGDLVLPKTKPSIRNTNGPLYEKRNHNSNGNSNSIPNGFMPNGKITNLTVNSNSNSNSNLNSTSNSNDARKYFQKGSRSVDRGASDNVSLSDSFRELNRNKSQNTSLNSLSSILVASRNGQIGPNKKKPNKGKKPTKPPPPPKKEDVVVEEFGTKRSWKQRLKFFLTLIASIVLIFSSSSLLFIVPLIVDPILVGLEAQFSSLPAQCRTVSKRNGTGSDECTIPSCREGCTADLLSCYFIEVEYQVGIYNTTSKSSWNAYQSYNRTNVNNQEQHGSSRQDENQNASLLSSHEISTTGQGQVESSKSMDVKQDSYSASQGPIQEGILLVSPSGCGYPPEINCTIFEKKYGEIGYTFDCYFSNQNVSIVVPSYSRSLEIYYLTVYLLVPCGCTLLSSALLYILLRWKPKPKRNKKNKVKEKPNDPSVSERILSSNNRDKKSRIVEAGEEDGMKLNILGTTQPVTIGNGTLSNIVGDLTGITSKNIMKKRHYTKFSTTFSNPNSQDNSRKASVSSLHVSSFDMDNGNAKTSNIHFIKESNSLILKPMQSGSLDEQPNAKSFLTRTTSLGNPTNYNFNEYSEKRYEKEPSHLLSGDYSPLLPSKFSKTNNRNPAHNSTQNQTTSKESKAFTVEKHGVQK